MNSFGRISGFVFLTCLVAVGLGQPIASAQNVQSCAAPQNVFSSNGFIYRLTSENFAPTGDIHGAIRRA